MTASLIGIGFLRCVSDKRFDGMFSRSEVVDRTRDRDRIGVWCTQQTGSHSHIFQRIVELRPAFAADAIGSPFDGKDAAHLTMAAAKYQVEDRNHFVHRLVLALNSLD